MKEIEKLQKEIDKKYQELLNMELQIKAMTELHELLKAAQETRKQTLEAYKVLHQVNNN
jgi:hypothetical protein